MFDPLRILPISDNETTVILCSNALDPFYSETAVALNTIAIRYGFQVSYCIGDIVPYSIKKSEIMAPFEFFHISLKIFRHESLFINHFHHLPKLVVILECAQALVHGAV